MAIPYTFSSDSLQSAPLVDKYGRVHTYLRISVTDRCNLRCVYCMPEEGVIWKERDEVLSFEEIVRLAGIFVRCGVTKIRLTGGEPTVRKGLPELAQSLSELPGLEGLYLTTNGTTLAQHAELYKRSGISGVNVSLDTLRPDRFRQIARCDGFEKVLLGIDAAVEVEFEPVKLNMVVMRGINDDELLDYVELARGRPLHVRFIEFMPFDSNRWSMDTVVPLDEMIDKIGREHRLVSLATAPSAVATDFSIEGFAGTVGFISSMTHSFCGDCNRLRLTADGQMKNCLFSTNETNLRDALRNGVSDQDLEESIRACVNDKWKEHPPMGVLERLKNRTMVQIGG